MKRSIIILCLLSCVLSQQEDVSFEDSQSVEDGGEEGDCSIYAYSLANAQRQVKELQQQLSVAQESCPGGASEELEQYQKALNSCEANNAALQSSASEFQIVVASCESEREAEKNQNQELARKLKSQETDSTRTQASLAKYQAAVADAENKVLSLQTANAKLEEKIAQLSKDQKSTKSSSPSYITSFEQQMKTVVGLYTFCHAVLKHSHVKVLEKTPAAVWDSLSSTKMVLRAKLDPLFVKAEPHYNKMKLKVSDTYETAKTKCVQAYNSGAVQGLMAQSKETAAKGWEYVEAGNKLLNYHVLDSFFEAQPQVKPLVPESAKDRLVFLEVLLALDALFFFFFIKSWKCLFGRRKSNAPESTTKGGKSGKSANKPFQPAVTAPSPLKQKK